MSGDCLQRLAQPVHRSLLQHLDLEEREILPLAARHVTAAEWNQMGAHGKDTMTPSQLPIRLALRSVGAWQFKRYVRRLRAT